MKPARDLTRRRFIQQVAGSGAPLAMPSLLLSSHGGDANGDGSDDVLAGVRAAVRNARLDSGSAYVFLGLPGWRP